MATLPTTSIRLPTELRQRLTELAKEQNRNVSNIVIHILTTHLNELDKKPKLPKENRK